LTLPSSFPFILVIVTRFLVVAILAFQMAFTLTGQQATRSTTAKTTTKTPPANDIFSGTVTAFVPESVTVVRKVPARPDESRQFIIDKDTKIEGRLRVNARVTVRFKADAAGAIHALRVIVRTDVKTGAGPGRTGTAQ
jgi:hypothetical protein